MLDLQRLRSLVETHGTVARVVVGTTYGSTPREVGAEIFVWADGQAGTIGGGNLEYQAIEAARSRLNQVEPKVHRAALGPALNQCCGGAVTLVTEVFSPRNLPIPVAGYFTRSALSGTGVTGAPLSK